MYICTLDMVILFPKGLVCFMHVSNPKGFKQQAINPQMKNDCFPLAFPVRYCKMGKNMYLTGNLCTAETVLPSSFTPC